MCFEYDKEHIKTSYDKRHIRQVFQKIWETRVQPLVVYESINHEEMLTNFDTCSQLVLTQVSSFVILSLFLCQKLNNLFLFINVSQWKDYTTYSIFFHIFVFFFILFYVNFFFSFFVLTTWHDMYVCGVYRNNYH